MQCCVVAPIAVAIEEVDQMNVLTVAIEECACTMVHVLNFDFTDDTSKSVFHGTEHPHTALPLGD